MDKIHILQLGTEDWKERYQLPAYVNLYFTTEFTVTSGGTFDITILDRRPEETEYQALRNVIRAHTLFVTENVQPEGKMKDLYECKCGQLLEVEQIQGFLLHESRFFYQEAHGERLHMTELSVAQHFSGSVKWNGNHDLTMQGTFGENMRQVAFWRNNITLHNGQVLDLWLEYDKDPQVEIQLEITQFADVNQSMILQQWIFDEKHIKQVVRIEGNKVDGFIFASVRARGEGRLQIRGLHVRHSRGEHGHLLPGGERYVTSEREELFAYYEPGDGKAPLNVCFSDFRTTEGFNGYQIMKRLGCPFLLLSESRLEGGCFFLGSEEYEKLVTQVIQNCMERLGYSSEEVIFFGISMGSSAAVYYGSEFSPHAVILGKPLVNIGSVAANEKWIRPGVFPAALDVLQSLEEGTDAAAVSALNGKFWDKFDKADWSNTNFIVAYMQEDDYDVNGYTSILEHLQSGGVRVYGKGIQGRHNDNEPAVIQWIMEQYHKILAEDYGRKVIR